MSTGQIGKIRDYGNHGWWRRPKRSKKPKRLNSVLGTGQAFKAGSTGLEPATTGVTSRYSNQLSYDPGFETR